MNGKRCVIAGRGTTSRTGRRSAWLAPWLAVVCVAGTVTAQSTPFTVDEAVRAALRVHPAVEAADANVAGAAARLRASDAARWPAVSLEASATRFAEPMVVAPLHGFDPQSPPTFDRLLAQGAAGVNWALLDAARGARIDRARAAERGARSAAVGTRQRVIAHTVLAYIDVVAARDRLVAHEARVTALERERERAAQFFAAGRAARVTQLRAEAALSAARADVVVARGEVDVAVRTLARWTALEAGALAERAFTAVRLAPGTDAAERSAIQAQVATSNAELEGLRSHVMAAQARQAEARALRMPRVQLTGRFVEYAAGSGFESTEWQGGVLLSYALFTGGAHAAARDQANAELVAARAELAVAQLDLATSVDEALAGLRSARERAVSLDVALARAEEVVRIERLALDAGAGVQTDYLNAEADLLAVRSALTDARRALLATRVRLATIAGELNEAWLATHLESGS